jgi:hypothetical protein
MDPHEQAHPVVGQAGQQPELPQRPGRVQPPPAQPGTGRLQLGLASRRVQRLDQHVVGEVEGGRVDPQGPAQSPPGPVQQLPEPRDQGQPRRQPPPDLLDPDAAVAVQKPGAVQDAEHADVLGPAEVVGPQHEEVLAAQPLQAPWLGHGAHLDR